MQLRIGFKSLFFILIVNTSAIHSMEIIPTLCQPLSGIFGALSSFLPSSPKSKKPRKSKLKKNKDNFEQVLETLKDDTLPKEMTAIKGKKFLSVVSMARGQDYDLSLFSHHIKPLLVTASNNPNNFLLYCYYQKHHDDWDRTDINYLITPEHVELLKKCQETHIDGFSALGAAIAAKYIAIKNKREFIQKLIDNGFELTEKDRLLAAIELHDGILTEQETGIFSLLSGHENFGILPSDVRRCITGYLIDIFKETLWPLFNINSKHAV